MEIVTVDILRCNRDTIVVGRRRAPAISRHGSKPHGRDVLPPARFTRAGSPKAGRPLEDDKAKPLHPPPPLSLIERFGENCPAIDIRPLLRCSAYRYRCTNLHVTDHQSVRTKLPARCRQLEMLWVCDRGSLSVFAPGLSALFARLVGFTACRFRGLARRKYKFRGAWSRQQEIEPLLGIRVCGGSWRHRPAHDE